MDQETVRHLFDYKDGQLIWKNPCARSRAKVGKRAGCQAGKGYRRVSVNGKIHEEHRVIFLWHMGFLPEVVDHINHVLDDNRIENLRAATRSQNSHNMLLASHNTSGVKNVRWMKNDSLWSVDIKISGKQIHVGCYKDIELAELVAIEAREKFHGEFACHG